MANQFPVPDFKKIAEEALKDIPKEVAEKARAFFLKSFIKQGFTDYAFIPWVKTKDPAQKMILQRSLALKGSLKINEASFKNIVISLGEGLNYAAIHNEGGTITVKVTQKMRKYFWFMFKKTGDEKYKWMAITKKETLTIKIPKRQMIGESETLNKELEQLFIERLAEAHKKIRF